MEYLVHVLVLVPQVMVLLVVYSEVFCSVYYFLVIESGKSKSNCFHSKEISMKTYQDLEGETLVFPRSQRQGKCLIIYRMCKSADERDARSILPANQTCQFIFVYLFLFYQLILLLLYVYFFWLELFRNLHDQN